MELSSITILYPFISLSLFSFNSWYVPNSYYFRLSVASYSKSPPRDRIIDHQIEGARTQSNSRSASPPSQADQRSIRYIQDCLFINQNYSLNFGSFRPSLICFSCIFSSVFNISFHLMSIPTIINTAWVKSNFSTL